MHSIQKCYTITIEPYSVEVFYNFNNKWIYNDALFIQENVQKPFKVTPDDGISNCQYM